MALGTPPHVFDASQVPTDFGPPRALALYCWRSWAENVSRPLSPPMDGRGTANVRTGIVSSPVVAVAGFPGSTLGRKFRRRKGGNGSRSSCPPPSTPTAQSWCYCIRRGPVPCDVTLISYRLALEMSEDEG